LNSSFVPVFTSNEDYRGGGRAPAEERAAYDRIYREALVKGFSTGTVHVYLMNPSGQVVSTLHVANAAQGNQLLTAMHRAADSAGVKPGVPLVEPSVQSRKPAAEPGSLVVYLVARGTGHGSWREFPSEDWIVLSREDAAAIAPAKLLKPRQTWNIVSATAEKLLRHFYPQTEQCDDQKPMTNRIDKMELTATVESVKSGIAHARLEGSLRMKSAFYPGKPDDNFVDASLVGYLDIVTRTGKIRVLRLVTDEATYGKEKIGVAAQAAL
jgi:hypothetical protein